MSSALRELYRPTFSLLTDLYELTMAYGYWKTGLLEREAVFHLFFRSHPFGSGFTICCGLESVVDLLRAYRFDDSDLAYLSTLRGHDDRPLFEPAFLASLREMDWCCDVDAMPEGTVVFPNEPLVRVRGPILQAQIVESLLLTLINFQTLIATKAARVVLAAGDAPVLEFGLRRAHGIDGGVSASRAAYIGGCAATSNVLAGRLLGIPVRGTHAHSWVMAFESESEAFEAYAQAMPNNCVFLVDTYDTLEGVRRATAVGRDLRQRGHEMVGIRLDSGDLAALSVEARRILDESGFPEARIFASNDLDESAIHQLGEQGAAIDAWGVGTKLVTAYDQPALGGVYKLAAVRDPGGDWAYRAKRSEHAAKTSNPGVQQIRRFDSDQGFVADALFDSEHLPSGDWTLVDPMQPARTMKLDGDTPYEDLLVPVFRNGRCVYDPPPLEHVRQRVVEQLGRFDSGVKRLVDPDVYPVGIEAGLHAEKVRLIGEVGRPSNS